MTVDVVGSPATGEHVGEPCQWIDAIEFRRHDERHHKRGPIGAAF